MFASQKKSEETETLNEQRIIKSIQIREPGRIENDILLIQQQTDSLGACFVVCRKKCFGNKFADLEALLETFLVSLFGSSRYAGYIVVACLQSTMIFYSPCPKFNISDMKQSNIRLGFHIRPQVLSECNFDFFL